ncbi:MAG: hypothetical protein WD176_01235, partial [Pirellulales bacterium]
MFWPPSDNLWIGLFWTTTAVGIVLGAVAIAVEGRCTRATWQRLAWLTMALSLGVAALVEASGLARGLASLASESPAVVLQHVAENNDRSSDLASEEITPVDDWTELTLSSGD